MKAIRALASAALAGLVLVALAIPAAAAPGDSELYRQATCGDLFRGDRRILTRSATSRQGSSQARTEAWTRTGSG